MCAENISNASGKSFLQHPNSSKVPPQADGVLGDDWGMNVVSVPVRTILITAVSLLIISSNMLNIVVLRMTDQIPANSRKFLLNLSLADLFVGVVSCLPCVYPALTGVWPYGAVWCQVAGITHGVSVTMSIWFLAFVSIDRYIAILHPLRYHLLVTPFRCHVMIACLWVSAIIIYSMPLVTKPGLIYYRFSPSEMMCGLYWEYRWFCVVTAVSVPVFAGTTLIFTTCRIVRAVSDPGSNAVAPHRPPLEGRVSQTNIKAIKVMVVTATTYFMAWGPYVVEVVLVSFLPGLSVPSIVRFVTIWMANSNSFMNVIIYSAMYSSFRNNCLWIFKCMLACLLCRPRPGKPQTGLDPNMHNTAGREVEAVN